MKRRDLIQRLALITGAALSPSVVQAMINGIDGRISINNRVMSDQQRAMCTVLSEMIIPRTDTPGAIDAGVPLVMGWPASRISMVNSCCGP